MGKLDEIFNKLNKDSETKKKLGEEICVCK